MERMLMEYLVNSMWQVGLVALGASVLVRAGRPGPRVQHGISLGALGLAVVLPALTMGVPSRTGLLRVEPAPTGEMAAFAPGAVASAGVPSGLSDVTVVQATRSAAKPGGRERVGGTWAALRDVRLGWGTTRWIVRLYVTAMAWYLARLFGSWWSARRAVLEARVAELRCEEEALLARCCERLGVRRPDVRVSGNAEGPLVVGVRRPVLVLPESLACGEGAARELEAVFLHELMHVRRRDCLANLLCRVSMTPVAYHPAAFVLAARVRRTREMVCDGGAAEAMRSRLGYAQCLVGMARRMQLETVGSGSMGIELFGGGVLEERVMELIGTKAEVSGRGRVLRGAACVTACGLVVGSTAVFHVTPMLAGGRVQAPVSTAKAEEAGPSVRASARPRAAAESHARIAAAVAGGAGVAQARESPAESAAPESEPMQGQRQLQGILQLVSPQMQARLQENLGRWNLMSTAERQSGMAEAAKQLKSPERQAQLERLQKELERLNSPDNRKQMQDALARLNSAEFQKRVTQEMDEAQRRLDSRELQERLTDMKSPQFQKQMASIQRQLKENLAHMAPMGLKGQLYPGNAPSMEGLSDQQLYDRGIVALTMGDYDSARLRLQTLVNSYPNSQYVGDAKKAIAKSWDSQGTAALVEAEQAYAAAGVEPKKIGAGVTRPALLLQKDPEYTPEAKAAKLSGTVLVNLWVDEQGDVQHARVVRGLGSGLDEKAIEAVHQYKFKPAMENGKPVLVALNVEVNFRIF